MVFKSAHPDVEIAEVPLHEFVLQRASELSDKPALIDGPTGRTITYQQLAQGVETVAAGLHGRGFGKGDVLAIFSPNIPEYAVAYLAAIRLGGVVTPANPLYTPEELAFQLNDAGAKFLVTIPLFIETAAAAAGQSGVKETFVFGDAAGATPFAELMKPGGEVPGFDGSFDDVIVLPYSSGTTGLPKGVMLTHRNLVGNIHQTRGLHRLSEDDVLIGILPFFHIYGMEVIMNNGLTHGATIVTMPKFDLEQFLTLVQDRKVTRAYLVPPIILALAKHPIVDDYDLSSLDVILSGAAPLGEELQTAVRDRLGCQVLQGYGLTETSPVTNLIPDGAEPKAGSVGQLVPNSEAKVVDVESGRELGTGERGELWFRGPHIMKGYLNNSEATGITIDGDGFLHTGDIGYVDDDGYFYIVDRLKELIKYKGFQVPPAELEALLLSHPKVADAAVIGVPDDEAGELPKAFVVPNGDVTEEEIMEFVGGKVAPHKKVRLVEITTEIPKSASGKILRRVLIEKERAAAG